MIDSHLYPSALLRARGGWLAVLLLLSGGLILTGARAGADAGDLSQKPGTAGCVSDTGNSGTCADGTALAAVGDLVVSPDGKNVYGVATNGGSVVVFDRDATSGALTQKAATAGCISDDGSSGACVDGRGLNYPRGLAISPDGKSVYVASWLSSAIGVFDRDVSTGALTQKVGAAGCVSETGADGCTDGRSLSGPLDVAVSPDGTSVYSTNFASSSVAVFTRSSAGDLTQKAGTAGCIREAAIPDTGDGCATSRALFAVEALAISADGKSVYTVTPEVGNSIFGGAIAIFDRAASGELTQKAGTAGCVGENPAASGCAAGHALEGSNGVAVSPDGASLYVVSRMDDAIAIFDRDGTGGLSQKAGSAGCISNDGLDPPSGTCTDGRNLDSLSDVVVAPGSTAVYVSSGIPGGLSVFTRAAGGLLTQRAGTAGCTNDDGTDGCTDGAVLQNVNALAMSPNGASVYAAAQNSSAVAVFDRMGGSPPPPPDTTPPVPPDTTPPSLTITDRPKAKVATAKAKLKVSISFVTESGAQVTCQVDKAAAEPCTSPFKAKLKSAGGKGQKHTIVVVATDAAGNRSAPAMVKIKVKRTR